MIRLPSPSKGNCIADWIRKLIIDICSRSYGSLRNNIKLIGECCVVQTQVNELLTKVLLSPKESCSSTLEACLEINYKGRVLSPARNTSLKHLE